MVHFSSNCTNDPDRRLAWNPGVAAAPYQILSDATRADLLASFDAVSNAGSLARSTTGEVESNTSASSEPC